MNEIPTNFPWSSGVARIPDEPWTREPVEKLAQNYDTVQEHSWYDNLDRTVEQLLAFLDPGDLLLDYSGGTGILLERLLARRPDLDAGILLVDASPKFLRLALEKFRGEPRVCLRRLRYLKEEGRLERLEEVLEPALRDRGVEVVVSTNAVHLYYGLVETLRSWRELLAPGGRAFVQSGNIGGDVPDGLLVIDRTVESIHREAVRLVRSEPSFARFRAVLDDTEHMEAHARLRRKYFLPIRPLEHYRRALEAAGFRVLEVERRPIRARVEEWYDFLAVYHEGVLGWAGGAAKITGREADGETVEGRLSLLRAAMERVFGGEESFEACWTYLTAEPA